MLFNSPYDRQQYLKFFRDEFLPEDFETHNERIKIDFQTKFIQHVIKIGESQSLEMNVYEITHKSENDPRITLSRESFRLLSQYGMKRALVLFVSENQPINYRLSLITIDLKWEEGAKVKKEYSNPHRYSFLLGPGSKTHTPESYLVEKGRVKDFDDLKGRFSIEVVNKDFYIEIACLFTELAGGERTVGRKRITENGCLSLPYTSDENLKKEFAVRLIGRLIFCWFLKKKNSNSGKALIPEELLSTQSVKHNQNFYHTILESLFFQTLNTPIEDRNELYKSTPWNQIPFLNGGLFEPGIHDYYDIDQLLGISKNINTLKIPDSWLMKLFKIFETYNFTIDENTSVDIELSIEPEMLGRIFENLLAEINPETGDTARKSTGSYYTPRPIVDFMVNESLKQYMLTKTEIEESKISSLLAYEEEIVELSEDEQDIIIDVLDNINIIDPACGSGAFPMGILQKMLLILQKIDPESKKWANKKIARIDYILKREFEKKIEEENWDYLHKLGIIQTSIYGVDIQSIAVEISKLRFFLSLIVDENIDDTRPNRGIVPLPNLEFKFVCANSLIGLPGKDTQAELFEEAKNVKELRELRKEYFRAYGDDKKRIEKKFRELQNKMFTASLEWIRAGREDAQSVKLSQWNPFSGEPCEWFDPDWMFGVKDGFDIVIANPPYIDSENMVKNMGEERTKIAQDYQTASGNWDLYIPFFELGFNLLSDKGNLCFIAPNKWLSVKYGEKLRKFLVEHVNKLCNCDVIKVFEAGNTPEIVLVTHEKNNQNIQIQAFDENSNIVEKGNVPKKILELGNWGMVLSDNIDVLITILENNKKTLSDYCDVENPFTVSEAYTLKKFIYDGTNNQDKNLLLVTTGTIDKYVSLWGIKKTTYIKDQYLYPFVEKDRFKKYLPRRYKQAISEKIIITGIRYFECFYDKEGKYIAGKSTIIIRNVSKIISFEALLAILNSNLISFYIRETYMATGIGGGVNFTSNMIKSIPIPEMNQDEISILGRLSSDIILLTNEKYFFDDPIKQEKLKLIMKEINRLVYQLYALKDGEIEIVENFNKK